MNCFVCDNALRPGASVQLRCSCFLALCQDCAREQLVDQPETYESCIYCPRCKIAGRPEDKHGWQECLGEEHECILFAFSATGKYHSPSEKDIKFKKLQTCRNDLWKKHYPAKAPDCQPEPAKSGNQLQKAIKKLRYDISAIIMDRYPNAEKVSDPKVQEKLRRPVDLISFTRNAHIERFLAGVIADGVCCVCDKQITPGQSVLLTCPCVVCRACVIDKVINAESTYHTGDVACPNPSCNHQTRGAFTVTNVPALKAREREWIKSASLYFGPFLAPGGKNHHAVLLRWFAAFGYTGKLSPAMLPYISDAQRCLQIAILEERRLHEAGLLRTTTSPIPNAGTRCGFLRSADIAHNSILERLLLQLGDLSDIAGSCSSSSSSSSASARPMASAVAAAPSLIAQRIEPDLTGIEGAEDAAAGLNACNALERLVWAAMVTHRDPTDLGRPYTFDTVEACSAVEEVLQKMGPTLGTAEHDKARATVEEHVVKGTVLQKLCSLGLLTQATTHQVYVTVLCFTRKDCRKLYVAPVLQEPTSDSPRWRPVDSRPCDGAAQCGVLGPMLYSITQPSNFVVLPQLLMRAAAGAPPQRSVFDAHPLAGGVPGGDISTAAPSSVTATLAGPPGSKRVTEDVRGGPLVRYGEPNCNLLLCLLSTCSTLPSLLRAEHGSYSGVLQAASSSSSSHRSPYVFPQSVVDARPLAGVPTGRLLPAAPSSVTATVEGPSSSKRAAADVRGDQPEKLVRYGERVIAT
jgi:hypothetical protein